jgi:hypothetical protein
MSGLSRTPGKRVYGESRTAGSNPALSATYVFDYTYKFESVVPSTGKSLANPETTRRASLAGVVPSIWERRSTRVVGTFVGCHPRAGLPPRY